MKTPLFIIVATIACMAYSEEVAKTNSQTSAKSQWSQSLPAPGTPERIRYDFYRITGGQLLDTRNQKGAVAIVNVAKAAEDAALNELTKTFGDNIHIAFKIEDGVFDLAKPVIRENATLFVVDDPALPMSLVAPEARWAVVNVAPLKTEKKPYYDARVRKMLARGMLNLLGVANTRIPNGITSCVTKPEDLDEVVYNELPFEPMMNMKDYFVRYGIVPYKLSTYLEACEQGWAHSPTNKWQQKIWKRTHSVPSNPMTIKFDPKTGK